MSEQRRQQLQELLVADSDTAPGSRMSMICARCVEELAVTGTGATVLSHLGDGDGDGHSPSRGLVHATNRISSGLEDLQLTVGEGPCLDTFKSGGPVLIADLAVETTRWPAFTREALELGAAALFSFPLQIGVVRLGSLDCYRDTVGPLTRAQISDGLILAELATHVVIAELEGHTADDVGWLADPHAEVHQAAGMVQVQLDTNTETALMRLRGYAYTQQLPLTEVARQVVVRSLRFPADEH